MTAGRCAYDGVMASRQGQAVARVVGLVMLVAGSVALGFALGMARPRSVVMTAGSSRPMAPAPEDTPSEATGPEDDPGTTVGSGS